jgi:hypothetical protein
MPLGSTTARNNPRKGLPGDAAGPKLGSRSQPDLTPADREDRDELIAKKRCERTNSPTGVPSTAN